MKKIVSLIFLVVLVASCTNDENDEQLYNEIQKIEKKINFDEYSKDIPLTDSVVLPADFDTVVSPPPPPTDPVFTCEGCEEIDPPKGGTKP